MGQTEAEIENLKGAISSRTAQHWLSAGGAGSPPANGNGHRPSSLGDAKGFVVTGHGQFLLQALAAAVDVASATERYAAACGLELQFTSEDLRKMGLGIRHERNETVLAENVLRSLVTETNGIQGQFKKLAPFLDERLRRLVAASESLTVGFGGTSVVSRHTGLSRSAIIQGIKELDEKPEV